jgi:flagellar basal body-associated protein FliL
MNKVMSILGVATKIMSFVVVTVIAIISIATAYIMFAPDEFPKPFRLMYNYATPVTPGKEAQVEAAPTPTPEPPKPGDGQMFNMSSKIINLADPTGRKYIKLTVVLEFMPPKEVATTEKAAAKEGAAVTATPTFTDEVTARMPIMDDVVIKLLSSKTFEDLYTADGKEKLRTELMAAIAKSVPDFELVSIYFTEFVVQ